MMLLPKSVRQYPLSKIIAIAFLVGLLVIGAVPGYITGKWSWAKPPQVATLKQLRNVQQKGLTLPGWQTVLHESGVIIGGHKWSFQQIESTNGVASPISPQTPAVLLLLPQNDGKNQPEVEWMDINGYWRWNADSYRQIHFSATTNNAAVDSKPRQRVATVEAQFFRTWTNEPAQTYAVMQWYAFPTGGHPAPSHWFWADRFAQLYKRRVPWVAVSVQMPIEPLGDIEKVKPQMESLGKTVQAALMQGPLQ